MAAIIAPGPDCWTRAAENRARWRGPLEFKKNAKSVKLHGWEACIIDIAAARLCPGWVETPFYVGLHELPDEKRNTVENRLLNSSSGPDTSVFDPCTNVMFIHKLICRLMNSDYAMTTSTGAELPIGKLGRTLSCGQTRSRVAAVRNTS